MLAIMMQSSLRSHNSSGLGRRGVFSLQLLGIAGITEAISDWPEYLMLIQGRERRDVELLTGREVNSLHWHPSNPEQLATSGADNLIRRAQLKA